MFTEEELKDLMSECDEIMKGDYNVDQKTAALELSIAASKLHIATLDNKILRGKLNELL